MHCIAAAYNRQWVGLQLGVGRGAKPPHHKKNKPVRELSNYPQTLTDSLDKRPKLHTMDRRFGTCNIRSLNETGSPMTVSRELIKSKLHLVGVGELR
jgi:hypothetical protein